ncbi:glycosyltransferase family 2 protein [Variovorax sp. MHTC-1]|uniref:glycosyltransferase family 2 protein n=1 Tax=Variovorax sp. MHTC-1 TaxID=2495593 RepID=UPI000F8940E3|nr:glycosyltransferase family 2 protein [Variovorax sp. MHTC-1]RST54320.1 glycosyltransferase family 2 protein [Variovorax sp. MHTC-1]
MSTSPSSSPAVTVSIVSHGQLELVRPLLEQLDRFSRALTAKVVLTQNIAEPDLLAGTQWGFEIERIENAVPLGFGANHNQAFDRCTTPWFLVLNPDIRFDRDVLAPLIAQAAPDSGLLTPRILEPGKSAPEQHRAIITPLEILRRKRPDYELPLVPDWIPGLFMLFRSEAYRQVGGFDERFFMYGEDFDICARTRLAGWRLQVAEDLTALHDAQRASRTSLRHLYWHVTSLLKVWLSGAFWRYRKLAARYRA